MNNNPSMMNTPSTADKNINQSELYRDLQAKLDKLNNFDNDVVGGMSVINQMPKIKTMMVNGRNNRDLGPIIEAAKKLLTDNMDKLRNKDSVKLTLQQEKAEKDAIRLEAIKTKLETLYNYESNPAIGNQTLMSMPAYAERINSGKGVNMNAILADAIETTQRIVNQLEKNKKE